VGGNTSTIKKNKFMLEASKEVGLEINIEEISIWFCLVTKMQTNPATSRLLIKPLKMWQHSCTWQQQQQIKLALKKRSRAD
jgi:hypothetical protein